MSAAIHAKTAKERAAIALRMIKANKSGELGRSFDDCFEMGDGDEVYRIVWEKAKKDPALFELTKKALVVPPELKQEVTANVSEHTPGPWKVGPEYYDNPKGDMKAVYCGSFADTATSVARHVKPADARLIAAAPELLEALKGVRDSIEALATVVKGERAKWHLVLDTMNATIAKAEGK